MGIVDEFGIGDCRRDDTPRGHREALGVRVLCAAEPLVFRFLYVGWVVAD